MAREGDVTEAATTAGAGARSSRHRGGSSGHAGPPSGQSGPASTGSGSSGSGANAVRARLGDGPAKERRGFRRSAGDRRQLAATRRVRTAGGRAASRGWRAVVAGPVRSSRAPTASPVTHRRALVATVPRTARRGAPATDARSSPHAGRTGGRTEPRRCRLRRRSPSRTSITSCPDRPLGAVGQSACQSRGANPVPLWVMRRCPERPGHLDGPDGRPPGATDADEQQAAAEQRRPGPAASTSATSGSAPSDSAARSASQAADPASTDGDEGQDERQRARPGPARPSARAVGGAGRRHPAGTAGPLPRAARPGAPRASRPSRRPARRATTSTDGVGGPQRDADRRAATATSDGMRQLAVGDRDDPDRAQGEGQRRAAAWATSRTASTRHATCASRAGRSTGRPPRRPRLLVGRDLPDELRLGGRRDQPDPDQPEQDSRPRPPPAAPRSAA